MKAAPKRAALAAREAEAAPLGVQGALGAHDVDDRREVDVHARGAQRRGGGAPLGAGRPTVRPVAAIAGALRDGAPGRRCTLPPSWSTMSSSGARSAGRPRDAPQRPRERADLRRRAEVGAQEDDARGLAAADAREQRPRRGAPGEGEDDVLAGELGVGQRGAGAPRASRPPSRPGPPSRWSRRPPDSSLAPQAASARATAASAAARALTARSWSPRSGAARPRR